MRAAVLIFALVLAGCATAPDLTPQPSPQELATPAARERVTSVDIPDVCNEYLAQVPHPTKAGMNAKVAYEATDHALTVANGRIKAAKGCDADLRASYGRQK